MSLTFYSALDAAVSVASEGMKATASSSNFTQEDAQSLASNLVTLMGMSFILGVLFTTFILLILDFIRRNKPSEE
jgi:hypothetical protein